ncbi:uncharacterized protein LOC115761532 [Drosophila novamexicana]|uniref:uncharacterized protein LOC115761532 n=1 Tax=Drosophila novamexicana TaxID=47314 RepID=UPI0011E5FDE7|nr:uncharacterized protein LOC115761532 [Drosophila novamexicana]
MATEDEPDPLALAYRETASVRAKSLSKLYSRDSTAGRRTTNVNVPNMDRSASLNRFKGRHEQDGERPNFAKGSLLRLSDHELRQYHNDAADMRSREPSFTKFMIPYEMICAKRYQDSIKAYEAQLVHEIKQNVNFQGTAADACYFMRCISYTTFWPPLHNMTEVNRTSKNFFKLTEKERWRLQNIMDTDIT